MYVYEYMYGQMVTEFYGRGVSTSSDSAFLAAFLSTCRI